MKTTKEWLKRWLCGEEINRLKADNELLSASMRNATDKAMRLQDYLNELTGKPCPTCESLKQVVNFHVLAAGSRVKMFSDVGPDIPPPKELDLKALEEQRKPSRREINSKFLREEFPKLQDEERKFFESLVDSGIRNTEG